MVLKKHHPEGYALNYVLTIYAYMKVLFCHDGPFTRYNGTFYTTSLTDGVLSRYFKLGTDLSVVIRVKDVSDESKIQGKSEITIPVKIIPVPEIKTLKGIIKNSNKANCIIKEAVSNADLIIGRMPATIARIAIEEAFKQGKPCLVEVVGHPFEILWHHSLKGKLLAYMESCIAKRLIKKAPYVLYVTKEYLQKDYPTSGLNVGIADSELKTFDDSVLVERLDKIKQGSDKLKLCTIGAVNVIYKGQEFVIRALSILKAKGIDKFEYYVVGGGDNSRLKTIAEECGVLDNVKFVGSVPHANIFSLLQDIDIYMQPSMTEGLPRSVIEAISMAVPCIGSNAGGIPELIDKEYIFDKNKNQSIQIAAILEHFTEEKLLEQAQVNFKRSKEYDTLKLNKIRDDFYLKIYEEVMGKR